jgi:predicted nucleic acid-binding protein
MKYLLDVNVLVAFGLINHSLNIRVTDWILANAPITVATCAITELGFVRIIAQTKTYGLTVGEAKTQLLALKGLSYLNWEFLGDDLDISQLPAWVSKGNQTTDGHLLELAKSHGAILATLDAKIPGAFLIP